jgi:hypothetical membrane protein
VLINQLIGMFCAQAQLHVLIYIYIYIYMGMDPLTPGVSFY